MNCSIDHIHWEAGITVRRRRHTKIRDFVHPEGQVVLLCDDPGYAVVLEPTEMRGFLFSHLDGCTGITENEMVLDARQWVRALI